MNSIRLGDILLFSNNTPTGFLIRTFTSSIWNHVGIAIRYRRTETGDFYFCDDGELCILETNACKRYDPIKQTTAIGVAFSNLEHAMKKYNRIDVRRIAKGRRPENFPELLKSFSEKYRSMKFPKETMPFISVTVGFELTQKDPNTAFCSELVANYILECLDVKSKDLSEVFDNSQLPRIANLYIPEHYDISQNPLNKVLLDQRTVYIAEADLLYVIFQPLLLILVIILIIILALW